MREKYILRDGVVGVEPDAWILGIYYTPFPSKGRRSAAGWRVTSVRRQRGTLTIGGPKGFAEEVNEVLMRFFGVDRGLKDDRVEERQKDTKRKRRVFDVKPISLHAFRLAVRRMRAVGINVTRVSSTGRLMR